MKSPGQRKPGLSHGCLSGAAQRAAGIQAKGLERVNDSEATVHMKSPSQLPLLTGAKLVTRLFAQRISSENSNARRKQDQNGQNWQTPRTYGADASSAPARPAKHVA